MPLRAALDDPGRASRLLHDIAAWDPIFAEQALGGVRRETVEIHAAMQKLGFIHRYGRPLLGDDLPTVDHAVARIEAVLREGPFTEDRAFAREEITEIVRKDYLSIDPWPFEALVV